MLNSSCRQRYFTHTYLQRKYKIDPKAFKVMLLTNAERCRHAVKRILCEIDSGSGMQRIFRVGHVMLSEIKMTTEA